PVGARSSRGQVLRAGGRKHLDGRRTHRRDIGTSANCHGAIKPGFRIQTTTMKTKFHSSNRKYIWKKLAGVCTLVTISLALGAWIADAELTKTGLNTKETQQDACSRTSLDAVNSCRASAQSAYSLSLGNCDNIPDLAGRQQCRQEALAALHQALQTCQDQ